MNPTWHPRICKTHRNLGLCSIMFHPLNFSKPMKPIRFSLAALALVLTSLITYAQTAPALTAYYGVKDALVKTDAAHAKINAGTLADRLEQGRCDQTDSH